MITKGDIEYIDFRYGSTLIKKIYSQNVVIWERIAFESISAGSTHSLGITSTGVAYGWGNNTNGRFGDNTTVSKNTPVQVCGGLTFTSISAGDTHSLGITSTGVAYGWGLNSSGQLGRNSTTSSNTPVQVCQTF
jgi:alpha-tubulin suppressor-like RCC1 family protein